MTDTDRLAALPCMHEDAIEFRTEPASVEIGKCPKCGEDTEWQFLAGVTLDPRPAPDTALREAAKAVLDIVTEYVEWNDPVWVAKLDALRAALEANPGYTEPKP